jgi:hypothetical protein
MRLLEVISDVGELEANGVPLRYSTSRPE